MPRLIIILFQPCRVQSAWLFFCIILQISFWYSRKKKHPYANISGFGHKGYPLFPCCITYHNQCILLAKMVHRNYQSIQVPNLTVQVKKGYCFSWVFYLTPLKKIRRYGFVAVFLSFIAVSKQNFFWYNPILFSAASTAHIKANKHTRCLLAFMCVRVWRTYLTV